MRTRFELGWPFAAVGCVAGLGLACQGDLVAVALGCTLPLCLWLIGKHATRAGYRGWLPWTAVFCWLYGAVLDVAIGQGDYFDAPGIGALYGIVIFCLLALPLAAFATAARSSDRARRGSLAARSEDRFVWAAGLLTFDPVFFAAAGRAWMTGRLAIAGVLLLVLLGVKLVVVVANLALARRMTRLGARAITLPEERYAFASEVVVVDLGVGDLQRGDVCERVGYREAPRFARVVVGDAWLSAALVRERTADYGRLHLALYGLPASIGACVLVCSLVLSLAR